MQRLIQRDSHTSTSHNLIRWCLLAIGCLLLLPSSVRAGEAVHKPAVVLKLLTDVTAKYPKERYLVAEGVSDTSCPSAGDDARVRITAQIRSSIKVRSESTTSSVTEQQLETYNESLVRHVSSSAQAESARLARPVTECHQDDQGLYHVVVVLDRKEAAGDLERQYTHQASEFRLTADRLKRGQIRKEERQNAEDNIDAAIVALQGLGWELESVERRPWAPMHEDLTLYHALKTSLAARISPIKKGSVDLTLSGPKDDNQRHDLEGRVQSCLKTGGWDVHTISDDPTHHRLYLAVEEAPGTGSLPACLSTIRVTHLAPRDGLKPDELAPKSNHSIPGKPHQIDHYQEAACKASLDALLSEDATCSKLLQALEPGAIQPGAIEQTSTSNPPDATVARSSNLLLEANLPIVDDRLLVLSLVKPPSAHKLDVTLFNQAMLEAATRIFTGPDLRIMDETLMKALYPEVAQHLCLENKCFYKMGRSMQAEYLLIGVLNVHETEPRFSIQVQLLGIRTEEVLTSRTITGSTMEQLRAAFGAELHTFSAEGKNLLELRETQQAERETQQAIKARTERTRLVKRRLSSATLVAAAATLLTFAIVPQVMNQQYQDLEAGTEQATFDEAWDSATTWANWQKPGYAVGAILSVVGGVGIVLTF